MYDRDIKHECTGKKKISKYFRLPLFLLTCMILKADTKNKAWVPVIFITIFFHLTITLTSKKKKKNLLHWAGKI